MPLEACHARPLGPRRLDGVSRLLVDLDRLARARDLTAAAGLDALLVSPGPDLRYLTGYDALPARAAHLPRPPAGRRPGRRRPAPRASRPPQASPLGDGRRRDPRLGGDRRPVRPGRLARPGRQAGRRRRPHVGREGPRLSQRAAGRRAGASPASVLRELRMRKSAGRGRRARAAPARPSTPCTPQVGRVAARRPHRARGRRRHRRRDPRRGPLDRRLRHRRAPAPTARARTTSSPTASSRPGDPVVVDIGGTTPEGYCSDETRTYVVGEPPAEFVAFYAVLQAAQEAACVVGPAGRDRRVGRRGRARRHRGGRLRRAFVHRTGHGIGLSTHEEPYIVAGNTSSLEPGMAFSIEPGIYLAGRYGARIEDIVVVHRGRRPASSGSTCARASSSCWTPERRQGRTRMALTVERELPTDEAHELLALTREIVDRELAPPRSTLTSTRSGSRARRLRPSARPACWAWPTPRSTAAAVSRTRSTSRSSRRSPRPGCRWASA